MRRGKAVLFILAAVCGLAGCGQDKIPEVSSVSIGKDGGIVHQIVGDFEQNYYEMDSLETMAAGRVEEYCADNGADSVTLQSVEKKDDRILILLNYATDQDYSGFNHRELYVGPLAEAKDHGYQLEDVAFISADGKPMELGYMEEQEKKKIVVIATKPGEELLVNTYGKTLYINQSATSDLDVSFSGRKGARISYPVGEDDANDSILSYIVFE